MRDAVLTRKRGTSPHPTYPRKGGCQWDRRKAIA